MHRLVWYGMGFVSAFFCMAWTPLPNHLLAQLEHATHAPADGLDSFVGVVVLGGNGDRLGPALELARQHAQLRVLYTDGSFKSIEAPSSPGAPVRSESERFLRASGLPENRLLFEREAQNTRENAVLSAGLEGVDITQPWLLMTSAAHMPRALATFKVVGWNVTAHPVEYKISTVRDWRDFSMIDGAALWQNVFYEALAWAEYRLRGWV
ncbi:MAG: hypothetical protein RL297_157 [Pseudomonadota bacterium]|jgi:uncharacterized SAM-binding protein YcdF (DUF218 family)